MIEIDPMSVLEQVIHHGGRDGVTGSCHELRLGHESLLIDCGLFQGVESRAVEIDFPTAQIKGVILTHAHIDHIGRLPWLLAAGFKGPIYCTPATAELMPLMLADGLRLQLGLGHGQVERILNRLRKQVKQLDYGRWLRIPLKSTRNFLYLRFSPAGHILGSAITEIKLYNGEVIVFSGDLGPRNTPLLPDPLAPKKVDYLLLDSTYGDSLHDEVATRGQRLKELIERSLRDGGVILIPAFSVGRTQELLFDIERLIFEHSIDANLPVILDSPMAQKVTQSYRRFKKLWGREAKSRLEAHRHPLAFEQCVTIEGYVEHKALVARLAQSGEAAIVVAASGMCQGGRIMDYLKALLPDKRTDLIFAGYQAEGTLGHAIQSGDKQVWIDGEPISVNAHVHSMSGYSAHADQADLIDFVEQIESKPKQIRLIHGEDDARQQLATKLRARGHQVES
jgi:metallo-beta-lactamase family protein